MIVRKKEEVPVHVRADHVEMTDFFGEACQTDGKVSMGYAVFPPGTVVPPASHTGDEYSYIISGRVKCESNGKVPAGEMHKSMNDSGENATLVWMLIEKG